MCLEALSGKKNQTNIFLFACYKQKKNLAAYMSK